MDLLFQSLVICLLAIVFWGIGKLIAAAFSLRVRQEIASRPVFHAVWFLLAVVGAGLFFIPPFRGVPHTIVRAKVECRSLAVAARNFHSEYGRFPLQPTNHSDHLYVNDYGPLLDILQGQDKSLAENPRAIIFIELRKQNGKVGLDSWNNTYHVLADWSGDGQVTVGTTVVTAAVAVWSNGPNKKNEFGRGDDIRSW